jgi:hypothetical protein
VKNLTWQNPEQLFVAQELINKVKSKCCGIKDEKITGKILSIRNKHFTRMLAKIPYTIRMKTHDDERHILAEPSEEFQDSP